MMAIVITAPMHGWVGPLDEVPDPVFAERMMGNGIAIDPLTGEVRAPCAARVLAVAATRHSVTLELENGAHLLMHIGLETVAMAGEGFVAHTAPGAAVAAGDLLLTFDLDLVARRAKSLITPIVVINDGFTLTTTGLNRLAQPGEAMFEVLAAPLPLQGGAGGGCEPLGEPLFATAAGKQGTHPQPLPEEGGEQTITLVTTLPHGLHARPAATIVAALKPFTAEVAITAHDRTADARSIVALLGLGIAYDDSLRITATGPDAAAALAAVTALLTALAAPLPFKGGAGGRCEPLGEPSSNNARQAPRTHPQPLPEEGGEQTVLRGTCASPGIATGPIAHLRSADPDVPDQASDPDTETARLDTALATLLEILTARSTGAGGDIFAAHAALLDDPTLQADARRRIAAGRSAGFAWRTATAAAAQTLRATGDARLAERVADLTDLERQLLAILYGTPAHAPLPPGCILVTAELLPSQFIALDAATLAGIATAGGGPTSHVAILAASAGIPMLVAAGPALLALSEGQTVILDAGAGTLDTDPATIADAQRRIAAARTRRIAAAAAAHDPCFTSDGVRIEVAANLASLADADAAVSAGADGCGLLRTEFLFEGRDTPPGEAEQRDIYARIAVRLDGRPLIVRTLDSGGDKPAAWLPVAREDNPALGVRGIRIGLARPDLLAVQLRAILRGVPAAQCRIMLPMIVDIGELRRVRQIFAEACTATGCAPVPLGVMIETPAAALLAESLAAEADFLSIGSNDLTQYALAADRGNPALASMIDPLHPAVLRLIAAAAAGARQHGRWLGVCGGVASDPSAAAILIGLGVTELSAVPAAIPVVKAAVRLLDLGDCRALAERALAAATAAEVRALIAETE